MYEFKIRPRTALTLLTERMKYELRLRIRIGEVDEGSDLKSMCYPELLKIAETAALDLVSLMPLEVFLQESNLSQIVTKTIRMLRKVFDISEFENYSETNALILMRPIYEAYKIAKSGEKFLLN
ncbi:MAG: hypothetical protein V1720_00515 [bacterium]